MYNQYVPLELGLIEQGRFMADAREQFAKVQKALIDYRREHGDKAKGAKATLNISVSLVCEKGEGVSLLAQNKVMLPQQPPSVTMAIAPQAEDKETNALFVSVSGSREDSPRQEVMCNDDGTPLQTAEVGDGETEDTD